MGLRAGWCSSALLQADVFPSVGLILATIGAIHDSGGRRSTNTISIIAFSYLGFWVLTFFSKQAMLTPMVCWIIGAFYSRLKVRFVHIVAVILMVVVNCGFVSPSSASRDFAEGLDTSQRVGSRWAKNRLAIRMPSPASSCN